MRSRSGLALALAATTACATVPRPEGSVPVEAGQRVRVTLASRVATGPLQGEVVAISPDTLVVAREEGGERRLSRGQVETVEVSVGREREPVRAARYGILAGAPLLVLLILFAPIAAGDSGTTFGIVMVPVAALAAVGAAIGSDAQDVWVDAVWPSTAGAPSADSLFPDSLAAKDR